MDGYFWFNYAVSRKISNAPLKDVADYWHACAVCQPCDAEAWGNYMLLWCISGYPLFSADPTTEFSYFCFAIRHGVKKCGHRLLEAWRDRLAAQPPETRDVLLPLDDVIQELSADDDLSQEFESDGSNVRLRSLLKIHEAILGLQRSA